MEESVPAVLDNATTAPPVARFVPPASFSCIVISDVLTPLAVINADAAVIVDVAVLGIPLETNVTVSVSVMGLPFKDPVTVAVAGKIVDVSVAEKVPSPLSVSEESVPVVVDRTGIQALVVKSFSAASFNCTMINDVLVPFAAMDDGVAVMSVLLTEATLTLIDGPGKFTQGPLVTDLRIYVVAAVTGGS